VPSLPSAKTSQQMQAAEKTSWEIAKTGSPGRVSDSTKYRVAEVLRKVMADTCGKTTKTGLEGGLNFENFPLRRKRAFCAVFGK